MAGVVSAVREWRDGVPSQAALEQRVLKEHNYKTSESAYSTFHVGVMNHCSAFRSFCVSPFRRGWKDSCFQSV